ncbi:MAG: hypothetical protein QXG39_02065 [Candidatus Aenigmatarchaeota archaeon]
MSNEQKSKLIDCRTFEELKEELNSLIRKKIELLYKRFGLIRGDSDMAIAFLQGLSLSGFRTDSAKLFLSYRPIDFKLNDRALVVQAIDGNDYKREFRLECDDEFVRRCINNSEYVWKLDELFDFVENFLIQVRNSSKRIKDEIMNELKKTRVFREVASQRLLDKLAEGENE